jgi:hypothetical protein
VEERDRAVTPPPGGLSRDAVRAGVRETLQRLKSAPRAEIAPQRWAYREAAALLTRFDPATLKPVGEGEQGAALLHLLDDCVSIGDPSRGQWTLKPGVRVDALRRLGGRERAIGALGTNSGPACQGVERAVQAYLLGTAQPLESQSPEQLQRSLQAVRWLSQVPGVTDIPTADEIAAVHRRKQLVEPLHALVGDTFYGREPDLAELRLHVGLLQPSTFSTKVRGAAQKANPVGSRERPPLMVFGPPGMGKSTLLAKLVLDHARPPDGGIPFVYADFERPTLSIMEPATLLAEAARQLATQYPAAMSRLDRLAAEADEESARQRTEQAEVDELAEVSAARGTVHRRIVRDLRGRRTVRERELIGELVDALLQALAPGARDAPPLLVVLDSFEQAQYRSSPFLRRIWDMFAALQDAYPMVRVVVSGRAPVDELKINRRPARYHRLKEFDLDARIGLLRAYGVEDTDVARLLATQFGGNPLSLRLAAAVAARERWDTGWVNDVPTRRLGMFRITGMQIQARLYERLLLGRHDKDVERLAHPGLVLRRINAEIIQEVLAEPCGVDVSDRAHADALFERFAAHVDLVKREEDGSVSHRPDLRRDMLPLVEASNPTAAEEIERRAVAYHARQPKLLNRAEELYHRLRLGESPRSVDALWEPGLARYLAWAQPEVPVRAQSYLAAKMEGGHVPPEVLAEADLDDWELLTAREVRDLLEQTGDDRTIRANASAALELMAARSRWSLGSPLYPLLAEALALAGRPERAEETVEKGISSIRDMRAPSTAAVWDTLLDLLILGGRFLSERGRNRTADLQLAEAEGIAERLGRGLDALGAQLIRVRLQARGGAEADAVRRRASSSFLALGDAELREKPALVRSVAEELGSGDGDVLARAIDLLDMRPSDPSKLDALAAHIRELAAADPELAAWLQEYASRRGVRLRDAADVGALLQRLLRTGRLGELARALVAQSDPNSETRRLLIELLSPSAAHVDLPM